MPVVRFTENIQRHVECPEKSVEGRTVGESLAAYFVQRPSARAYVLDEHGRLRSHMALFVDGRHVSDRIGLSDAVNAHSRIDVFQALSGG